MTSNVTTINLLESMVMKIQVEIVHPSDLFLKKLEDAHK